VRLSQHHHPQPSPRHRQPQQWPLTGFLLGSAAQRRICSRALTILMTSASILQACLLYTTHSHFSFFPLPFLQPFLQLLLSCRGRSHTCTRRTPPCLTFWMTFLQQSVFIASKVRSALHQTSFLLSCLIIYATTASNASPMGLQANSRHWNSQAPPNAGSNNERAFQSNFSHSNELTIADSLKFNNYSQKTASLQIVNPPNLRHGHAQPPSRPALQQHIHRAFHNSDRVFKVPTMSAGVKLRSKLYRAIIEHTLPSDGGLQQQFEAHFLQGFSSCYSGLSPSAPGRFN
jgi:hypothetical protein